MKGGRKHGRVCLFDGLGEGELGGEIEITVALIWW